MAIKQDWLSGQSSVSYLIINGINTLIDATPPVCWSMPCRGPLSWILGGGGGGGGGDQYKDTALPV